MHDRMAGGAGAALVLAALGWMLLVGLRVETRRREPSATPLAFRLEPVARHEPKPAVRRLRSKAPRPAPPRNRPNKATEIAVLPPLVIPALPVPVLAALKSDTGPATDTGASDRAGSGRGAGGQGTGTGGDGNGADDLPPRLIRGRLKISDLPPHIREAGDGGTVSVRYRVAIDGRVEDCRVIGSSGQTELDELTCRLIEQRFRFAPSSDGAGRPVRSIVVEKHHWILDRAAVSVPRD